ncbi:hypothetical protein CHS0354_026770 [Potamilus streckersoni]|uniref:Glycosyl transferase family 1 domain-containing protein n=1 Tax=Potamilus streckersoni TaxID=2493646 RepID=A0AAE0W750_9BIVA|nr:hypothetical protein CHS0354_026770 [Potamilus streckersoni]
MACGTPVIALGRGGALETVIENPDEVSESTDKSARAINLAIQQFEKVEDQFSPEFLRMHAAKFHDDVFLNNMEKTIRRFLENCTR